jgi:hypothetical protein
VLAPLPASRAASALALYNFVRAFAQTWGITISSTILQNQLKKKLPLSFTAQFPQGVDIAFAAIPLIDGLEEPLRTEVRVAFAQSLRIIWLVMIGISGAGLLTMAFMKEVVMEMKPDERFALEERKRKADVESSRETVVKKVDTTHPGGQDSPATIVPGAP